jgi:hypothetical protein
LWQEKMHLERLNIQVIVVTCEPVTLPLAETEVLFPYFFDEKMLLYENYCMFHAGFWDLWGPRTWWSYLSLLFKGRKMIRSKGDIRQRGGDVLIDPSGKVRFHHVGDGPADRPDPETIFKLVENT